MTPCPWCGMQSVDDICPWCKRSKYGASWTPDGDDQLHPKDRVREVLGIAGAIVVVASLIAVILFGLMRPPQPVAQGTDPLVSQDSAAGAMVGYAMPPNSGVTFTPVATPTRVDERIPRSSARPARVASHAGASSGIAKTVGPAGIRVTGASLSTYDDGSGMPTAMGTVTIRNNGSDVVERLTVCLVIGERTYRLAPLGEVRIPPMTSLAVSVRSYVPIPKTEGIARQVVVEAQVGNPPALAMDSYDLR